MRVLESLSGDLFAGLLASAIGAVVVFLGQRARRALHDARIRRRYPVAGEYITYYDDLVDGTMVTTKASLSLKQRGEGLTGQTLNQGDQRAWRVEGSVLDRGLIQGLYYRTSPHDPGTGTFFMEPDHTIEGGYTGMWSGYDSVNRSVEGGRYRWVRQQSVVVQRLRSERSHGDLAQRALATLASGLGERYIDRATFETYLSDERKAAHVALSASGEMLGARLTQMLSTEEVASIQADVREAGSRLSLSSDNVGMLKSVAVRSEARGRGVGTALSRAALELLEQWQATAVISIAWVSGQRESSPSVLEGLGFDVVAEIENYWLEESRLSDYSCPRCGSPCQCSARVYLLRT